MANEPEVEVKAAKGGKGGFPVIPLLIVVLVIPVITLALTEFVIIPRLQSSMGAGESKAKADAGRGSAGGGGHSAPSGGGELGGDAHTYEFKDIICNLSGSMGTRFVKVNFEVAGSDPELSNMIKMKKPRVQDAIISTLSSKSIQDIEVPGGRDALRVALVSAINQAIGFAVVEELFFTEFIIQ